MNDREFSEAGEMVCTHLRTLRYWWQRYKAEGLKAAEEGGHLGHEFCKPRTLIAEQEWVIQQLISEKVLGQLKLSFALLARNAVRELIKKWFSLEILIRTDGECLMTWGFTPQNPLKRAYEQKPERVATRLKDNYPEILERAKAGGAEIHWGDERVCVSTVGAVEAMLWLAKRRYNWSLVGALRRT